MTIDELITDLKAAGANENTLRLAMNCYEMGKQESDDLTIAYMCGFQKGKDQAKSQQSGLCSTATPRQALTQELDAHKKNERHSNVAETRYWCDQYKRLAERAITGEK